MDEKELKFKLMVSGICCAFMAWNLMVTVNSFLFALSVLGLGIHMMLIFLYLKYYDE